MARPVLILSAVAAEIASLRDSLVDAVAAEVDGERFERGFIEGRPVVLGTVGVGKVNAAMAATRAIDHFVPDLVIFTGVAGAVDPSLEIGDVVVAEWVVQHDAGVVDGDGFHVYQAGHVPFFNPTDRLGYRPSPDLLARVRPVVASTDLAPVLGRVPRLLIGAVATGDRFIQSDEERRRLHESLGVHVVEMEGAAVAQIAEHLGVDHIVVRAVSDLAGADSPIDFERFLAEVSANSACVVRRLLGPG
jgi:adenosylhomocysteine nucleosidase